MNILKEVTSKIEKRFVIPDEGKQVTNYLVAVEFDKGINEVAHAAAFLRRVDEVREWGYKLHAWDMPPCRLDESNINTGRPTTIMTASLKVTR